MKNGFIVHDSMKTQEIFEGSENNFFISVNGTGYLVKDSSFNQKRKQMSLAPFCEYVGSNFIRYSGLLKCHETYLGKYCERDVVICKDLFKIVYFNHLETCSKQISEPILERNYILIQMFYMFCIEKLS